MKAVVRALRLTGLMTAISAAFVIAGPARAERIVGLTSTNALVTFDSASPLIATNPMAITGLVSDEQILSIDSRLGFTTVFGLSSAGRVYSLNTGTGAALLYSSLNVPLSGTSFGIDFNPTVDRLRVTSNTGQNLRINVDTGVVIVDAPLRVGGTGTGLVASAYANNVAGATTTALFGISSTADALYLQNPPNNGTLSFIGSLGTDTSGVAGFDISGQTGFAYAALNNGDTGKSSFYTLNLGTGAATLIGAFGYGGSSAIAAPLLGITVSPVPEPGTSALMLAGLLAVGGVVRRRRSA